MSEEKFIETATISLERYKILEKDAFENYKRGLALRAIICELSGNKKKIMKILDNNDVEYKKPYLPDEGLCLR